MLGKRPILVGGARRGWHVEHAGVIILLEQFYTQVSSDPGNKKYNIIKIGHFEKTKLKLATFKLKNCLIQQFVKIANKVMP